MKFRICLVLLCFWLLFDVLSDVNFHTSEPICRGNEGEDIDPNTCKAIIAVCTTAILGIFLALGTASNMICYSNKAEKRTITQEHVDAYRRSSVAVYEASAEDKKDDLPTEPEHVKEQETGKETIEGLACGDKESIDVVCAMVCAEAVCSEEQGSGDQHQAQEDEVEQTESDKSATAPTTTEESTNDAENTEDDDYTADADNEEEEDSDDYVVIDRSGRYLMMTEKSVEQVLTKNVAYTANDFAEWDWVMEVDAQEKRIPAAIRAGLMAVTVYSTLWQTVCMERSWPLVL